MLVSVCSFCPRLSRSSACSTSLLHAYGLFRIYGHTHDSAGRCDNTRTEYKDRIQEQLGTH